MIDQGKSSFSPADREKLEGLLGFAAGLLSARDKTALTLGSFPLCLREGMLQGLPGLDLDPDDEAWFRLGRLRESRPPSPPDYVAEFMSSQATSPVKPPELLSAIRVEATLDQASDLEEAELLRPENIHPAMDGDVEVEGRVTVILHLVDCPEVSAAYRTWCGREWAEWAERERPVRSSIEIYNKLFKVHSLMHTADAAQPELVWGVGIGRWKLGPQEIDMPIFEQSVDIDIEAGGSIAIFPRIVSPILTLKPYIEVAASGASELQKQLRGHFSTILAGDSSFSPFDPSGWEHLLGEVADRLADTGRHIRRQAMEGAGKFSSPEACSELTVDSSWAIYARQRSGAARVEDLEALRTEVRRPDSEPPASISGFAAPPEDEARPVDPLDDLEARLRPSSPDPAWTNQDATGPSSGSQGGPDGRIHFFPLPYNEEQARIVDLVDDPANNVVTVTGPPGTGKTHTIANIVSHHMATGKRVLVTARTAEAIKAVREKLPESLRSMVIASVDSDREGSEQLKRTASELSDEVVNLDMSAARSRRSELERGILACDDEMRAADLALARIAKANLEPINWLGEDRALMELVADLKVQAGDHAWFTDRPSRAPSQQLGVCLDRLKEALPRIGVDLVYAGVDLPRSEQIPSTGELIAARIAESRRGAEVKALADAPRMAFDTDDAEDLASQALSFAQALSADAVDRPAIQRRLCRELSPDGRLSQAQAGKILQSIREFGDLDGIAGVRFDLAGVPRADFRAAAQRGAGGASPVPGFRLLAKDLKRAVAETIVAGRGAQDRNDWRLVLEALEAEDKKDLLSEVFAPYREIDLTAEVPASGPEIARWLKDRKTEIEGALELHARFADMVGRLRPLFPYGLDLEALARNQDLAPAIDALRANLPEIHSAPGALQALGALAGDRPQPIFQAMRDLRDALASGEITDEVVLESRGELTRELARIHSARDDTEALARDLSELCDLGGIEWAERLRSAPHDAERLVPDRWREAWAWAEASSRVEAIISLGNGDAHRTAKAEAAQRRRKLLEELIRIRTLIGLQHRLKPSIRRALQAFTEAASRIGRGTGKSAGRYRREAQAAAREASSAAPVWIMPEYKIAEQLPPVFGDFDLVILDEASQSDITALAALARGVKILVVGDEEQVSPQNVAIVTEKIDALRAEHLAGIPSARLIDENTSIFRLAKRMHPDTHVVLREHFRCVGPIIQFSTRFYANRLIPLRVPLASERFDPPLVDVHIRGAKRDGRVNRAEAEWIVDEIARLVADPAHEHRDIGVISLIGREQSDLIQTKAMADPRIGTQGIAAHQIIFGDARTMQGQERSVVFLSMVATPDKVRAQTGEDDRQRINVAMSRAADRLYLVRSVALEDLKPTDIKSGVLQHFLDPLPEGRKESSDNLLDICDSGFEREVLARLLEANYRARPQVAAGSYSIDIVVEGAEDRRLAIELDGDRFHGPDVWERDMTRQAALERAGWVFWRVFGSQWNSDKELWWSNLLERLARLGIEPIGAEQVSAGFTEFRTVDPDGPAVQEGADLDGEPALVPEDVHAGSDEQSSPDSEATPSQEGGRTASPVRPRQTAMKLGDNADLFGETDP